MSLITEALQLRKSNPRQRGSGGESFPPLRRPNPAGKVFLVLFFLCGVGVLVFWKGTWAVEQLENFAGIRAAVPALTVATAPKVATPEKPAETVAPLAETVTMPPAPVPVVAAPVAENKAVAPAGSAQREIRDPVPEGKKISVSAEVAGAKSGDLPEPMDVNLTLSMIEDEKARQQLDEENQRKIESFLRRMDIQGVCHQGENSTALLDTVLVRPGDSVGDLGLTLRMIGPRRLVFADRNGREYTKSY